VIGLSLAAEAKAILAGTQERLVTAQVANFLARHRCCRLCARQLRSKGQCRILFRTAFGTIALNSPRFHCCACQPAVSKTFSPLTALFTEHTAPELSYQETRWASLVSYGLSADLLKDVLPIGSIAGIVKLTRSCAALCNFIQVRRTYHLKFQGWKAESRLEMLRAIRKTTQLDNAIPTIVVALSMPTLPLWRPLIVDEGGCRRPQNGQNARRSGDDVAHPHQCAAAHAHAARR
jgi:hypothetical protein